jgi:two-component system chemotaxis response regulator CheB
MANRDIVAIGTSAGGVEALTFLAKEFPPQFPASVLVTIHLPSEIRSTLDEVLSRAGPLPARFAGDGDVLKTGRIYVAPPNRHLEQIPVGRNIARVGEIVRAFLRCEAVE